MQTAIQTTFPKPEATRATWYAVSAKDQVLGVLAARVARVLMGKHRVDYTPSVDLGDHVVVTDAAAVVVSGRKERDKVYRYHTGYAGGLKEVSFGRMRREKPDQIIKLAIKRMLPKNRLGKQMMEKLRVYGGAEHEQAAQKPQPLP
jgi:large subunit ribosomal protein L13